jgi:hypothetical protein
MVKNHLFSVGIRPHKQGKIVVHTQNLTFLEIANFFVYAAISVFKAYTNSNANSLCYKDLRGLVFYGTKEKYGFPNVPQMWWNKTPQRP